MAQSTFLGYAGTGFVPLGMIAVATPGTPVRFTSLIDVSSNNAPESPTPTFSANNTGAAVPRNEYTIRCQQIIIQGVKSNGGNGTTNNTGNVYIMVKGNGSNNRTDFGAMVAQVAPGQTLILASAPVNVNVFNPYSLYLDADNAGDSALVTLLIQ